MKNIFIIILMILFFPFRLEANQFYSQAQLEEWYANYYLSPEPAKVPDAVIFYGESDLYQKVTSRAQFAYFIAVILKNNNHLIKPVYEEITNRGNDNSKYTYLNILWFIDSEESRVLIEKAKIDWYSPNIIETAEWLQNNFAPNPLYMKVYTASDLDLLWSHFIATGDDKPLKKIIAALELYNDKDSGKLLTASAAEWSLNANAKKYVEVLNVCKAELKTSKGIIKKKLEGIIREAAK